jgi:glycosyltransferase involved in cell wall biosynthesis
MLAAEEKEKDPLVSIIIPTFNSAGHIEACLKSISEQTYPKIETIVVDNLSTDSTAKIARKMGACVIDAKSGMSEARNLGIALARGEYVFSVDADMFLTRNVVKECVKTAEAGYGTLVVPEISTGEDVWSKAVSLEKKCYIGDENVESARFFKKSVFDELKGYDSSLLFSEDKDFDLRVRAHGVSVGRISSLIIHNEGKLNLRGILRKKYRYSQDFSQYYSLHPMMALKQALPLRIAFIKNWRLLLQEPFYALLMLFLKICEFTISCIGFVGLVASRRFRPWMLEVAVLLIFSGIIYARWLNTSLITFGDWSFLSNETMRNYLTQTLLWNAQRQYVGIFPSYLYTLMFGVFGYLNVSFAVAERVIFYLFFSVVSFLSPYYLARTLKISGVGSIFAALLFATNTYILHVIWGGQMTVALGYAFVPLTLAFFIRSFKESKIYLSVVTAALLTLIIVYDIRIGYVAGGILIFYLIYVLTKTRGLKTFLRKVVVPFAVFLSCAVVFNLFWLMPTSQTGISSPVPLPTKPLLTNLDFLKTMTLYHPPPVNTVMEPLTSILPWTTSGVDPLFLLIPAFAFASLLLVKRNDVFFFALLAVICIFLVKGINPPFADVYTWLFNNVLGFNGFREASKFFVGVTMSYSVLLGFTIEGIQDRLQRISNEIGERRKR